MGTEIFLDRHPVFSLAEAAHAFGHRDRGTTLERLRYHVSTGRLKSVARGIYARVPPSVDPARFHPDAFLVAATVRSDAIFSHHSALQLLGAAYSEWSVVTVWTAGRRAPLRLEGERVEFLAHPTVLVRAQQVALGVRTVDRLGQTLRVTGPERTLLDGFREPGHVGGVVELVESAAGFSVLDLELLRHLLAVYAQRGLYAATGWFLERHQRMFSAPDAFLRRLEKHRPRAPHYLLRSERGGKLAPRWNLILPEALVHAGEADDHGWTHEEMYMRGRAR